MASRSVLIPYDKYQRLLNQSSASSSQPSIPTLKSVLCPFCKLSLSRKDVMLRHVRNKHRRDLLWETRPKITNVGSTAATTTGSPSISAAAAITHNKQRIVSAAAARKAIDFTCDAAGNAAAFAFTRAKSTGNSTAAASKKEETDRPYDHSAKTIIDFLLSDCPSLFSPKKKLILI